MGGISFFKSRSGSMIELRQVLRRSGLAFGYMHSYGVCILRFTPLAICKQS